MASIDRRRFAALTRLRQSAEWGMRVIQGAFPRVKTDLGTNSEFRFSFLSLIVRLCNVRPRMIGNQLRSVFLDSVENDKRCEVHYFTSNK